MLLAELFFVLCLIERSDASTVDETIEKFCAEVENSVMTVEVSRDFLSRLERDLNSQTLSEAQSSKYKRCLKKLEDPDAKIDWVVLTGFNVSLIGVILGIAGCFAKKSEFLRWSSITLFVVGLIIQAWGTFYNKPKYNK